MSIQTLLQHFREHVKYGSEDSIMIHIHITEGNNLLSADNNGYSDPYFKIKIDDAVEKKQSTDHHPVTLNPVYHDVHTFVLNSSTLQGDITIEAMDYDRVSANDSLGFAVIPLRDLLTIGAVSGWYGLFQTPKCGANERNPGRFYVCLRCIYCDCDCILGDYYCTLGDYHCYIVDYSFTLPPFFNNFFPLSAYRLTSQHLLSPSLLLPSLPFPPSIPKGPYGS